MYQEACSRDRRSATVKDSHSSGSRLGSAEAADRAVLEEVFQLCFSGHTLSDAVSRVIVDRDMLRRVDLSREAKDQQGGPAGQGAGCGQESPWMQQQRVTRLQGLCAMVSAGIGLRGIALHFYKSHHAAVCPCQQ